MRDFAGAAEVLPLAKHPMSRQCLPDVLPLFASCSLCNFATFLLLALPPCFAAAAPAPLVTMFAARTLLSDSLAGLVRIRHTRLLKRTRFPLSVAFSLVTRTSGMDPSGSVLSAPASAGAASSHFGAAARAPVAAPPLSANGAVCELPAFAASAADVDASGGGGRNGSVALACVDIIVDSALGGRAEPLRCEWLPCCACGGARCAGGCAAPVRAVSRDISVSKPYGGDASRVSAGVRELARGVSSGVGSLSAGAPSLARGVSAGVDSGVVRGVGTLYGRRRDSSVLNTPPPPLWPPLRRREPPPCRADARACSRLKLRSVEPPRAAMDDCLDSGAAVAIVLAVRGGVAGTAPKNSESAVRGVSRMSTDVALDASPACGPNCASSGSDSLSPVSPWYGAHAEARGMDLEVGELSPEMLADGAAARGLPRGLAGRLRGLVRQLVLAPSAALLRFSDVEASCPEPWACMCCQSISMRRRDVSLHQSPTACCVQDDRGESRVPKHKYNRSSRDVPTARTAPQALVAP